MLEPNGPGESVSLQVAAAPRASRAFYRFRHSWLSLLGLAIVVSLLAAAAVGPAFVPYPDHVLGAVNAADRLQPPSARYWFGTTDLGQDVFSLVIAGARISLFCGVAVVALAASVGSLLGGIAGYAGGWIDEALMRVTDVVLALPSLVLAMAVAAALGGGLPEVILAIALSWWPGFARLARGEVIAVKEEAFVQSARAIGASAARILRRHILPNVLSAIVVKASLDVGLAILAVASLGFIGIGVKPPTPEWGTLLSAARTLMPVYWWTAAFPGLAISIAVLGFNLLGDGLRDVLDPRTRR
jgi:peptide/nickel transport system permease protein